MGLYDRIDVGFSQVLEGGELLDELEPHLGGHLGHLCCELEH
ncbi:hypothetical protein ACPCAE_05140 [Streptomyces cinereoruber]